MCFRELRDEHVFVIIYALVGSYFAGVMVRLMLTLTPIVCVSAAVVISKLYDTYLDPLQPSLESLEDDTDNDQPMLKQLADVGSSTAIAPLENALRSRKRQASATVSLADDGTLHEPESATTGLLSMDVRLVLTGVTTFFLLVFCFHCTWVTSSAYSSPSVVLASRAPDGSQNIIDDFREAYYWLRQNTEEDAKVMSWWDYGYQLAGFADRTTLVDVRLLS